MMLLKPCKAPATTPRGSRKRTAGTESGSDDERDSDFDQHHPNGRSKKPRKKYTRRKEVESTDRPALKRKAPTEKDNKASQGNRGPPRGRKRQKPPQTLPQLQINSVSKEWRRELAQQYNQFTQNGTTSSTSKQQTTTAEVKQESQKRNEHCDISRPVPQSPHHFTVQLNSSTAEKPDQATQNLISSPFVPLQTNSIFLLKQEPRECTDLLSIQKIPSTPPTSHLHPNPATEHLKQESQVKSNQPTQRTTAYDEFAYNLRRLEKRMEEMQLVKVLEWTVEDVCSWLAYIGLSNHVSRFQRLGTEYTLFSILIPRARSQIPTIIISLFVINSIFQESTELYYCT
jgi:hypothetical protein